MRNNGWVLIPGVLFAMTAVRERGRYQPRTAVLGFRCTGVGKLCPEYFLGCVHAYIPCVFSEDALTYPTSL